LVYKTEMDKVILPNPKDYEPIPIHDIYEMFSNLKKINRKSKAKERMGKLENMRLDRLEFK
jgi:hypothetical protein